GAGEVLQRLSCGAPHDEGAVLVDLLVGELVDERQSAALHTEDVGEQEVGIVVRRGDTGRLQPPCGRPASGAGPHQDSRACRRAARSASTQESSTGSRAPSSTWSRL